jgi:phthalate 4,5-dioxygenase oxygenase subunit
MLTAQDNALLTQVGPGTPMGNLLRRYWMPVLLSNEVSEPDSPPVRARILGEDLVAFRDTENRVGLVAQACPHRGASLFFGRNEEEGLRCVYHGWKFDTTGACVDMPSEPAESNFKTKVRVAAYPTRESGGIVWAYFGPPEKQPEFRDFGSESLTPEQWRASKVRVQCNWVQSMEGNLDTSHISWLHQYNAASDIATHRDQRRVVRLPLRRPAHHAQRPHARPRHRLHLPFHHRRRRHPARHRRRRRSLRSDRRHDMLALRARRRRAAA